MGTTSIIVPCLNAASTILGCIDSLKMQRSETPFEIIVVDNGSTDGTLEIIRGCSDIEAYSESRPGSYAARNLGLSKAHGEIVAFTDADCLPEQDWLHAITSPFSSPAVHVVVGRTEFAGKSRTLSLLQEYTHNRRELIFNNPDPKLYFGYTNNLATRMSSLRKFGYFENRKRGGDTIFVRKCTDVFGTESIRYCSDATVRHLEVTSVRRYVAKRYIYGWSSVLYSRVIDTSARAGAMRSIALSATLVKGETTFGDRIRLLGALTASSAAWTVGRLRGRFGKKIEPD